MFGRVRFQVQDIQNILDFIYNGELKIHQEDIDRFLVIAQRLKLDGLNDGIYSNIYVCYSLTNSTLPTRSAHALHIKG